MAPRKGPEKDETPKNRSQRSNAPVKKLPEHGVQKKDRNERKLQKSQPKEWLDSAADWTRFNDWAQKNAGPKKLLEPESMARQSKPLTDLQDRINFLSMPREKVDTLSGNPAEVSKTALTGQTWKAINRLPENIGKNFDPGRESPARTSQARLNHNPSERLSEISRPSATRMSNDCKLMTYDLHHFDRAKVNDKIRCALTKKAVEYPDYMTEKELDIIQAPLGIQRSSLEYEFTPWKTYLSLPSYRFLKERNDDDAENWKHILEKSDVRGKKEYQEAKGKREEVPPGMAELAVTTLREEILQKKDPYAVRQSALAGKESGRVDRSATPNQSREATGRPKTREENSSGRAFQQNKPSNKKEVRRPNPIKPAKCPDKNKQEEDDEERKKKRRKPIDPIVYEPTIDPCIDPERSERQLKARRAAKKELKRREEISKQEEKKNKKEETNKNEDVSSQADEDGPD